MAQGWKTGEQAAFADQGSGLPIGRAFRDRRPSSGCNPHGYWLADRSEPASLAGL